MSDTKFFVDTDIKLEFPCVLKFYFDGCMPCKKIAPKVDDILGASNFGRAVKITLYHVDTLDTKNEKLIDLYDVRKVPSFAVLQSRTSSTKLLSFSEFEKYMKENY